MDETLSDFDKSKLCSIIQMGCDRATACKYFGITPDQLLAQMQRDEEFAQNVLRAEAQAELQHMGNIHKASKDEKNWRTSVWWLERRARELDEATAEEPSLPEAVRAALDQFVEVIVAEIPGIERRQRVLSQLLLIAEESVLAVGGAKPQAAAAGLLAGPVDDDAEGS